MVSKQYFVENTYAATLDAAGKLVLGGNIALPDFTSENPAPWAEDIARVKEVHIGTKLRHLGANAVPDAPSVHTVIFHRNPQLTADEKAFGQLPNLETFLMDKGTRLLAGVATWICSSNQVVHVSIRDLGDNL